MSRYGLRAVFCLAAWTCAAPAQTPERTFVNKYCVGCHSRAAHAGNLVLQGSAPATEPEVWEKVMRRLRGRTMPPEGSPRPGEAEYVAASAAITQVLDARPLDPGRTNTFRRLTRTEYQNSVRDLLAVEIDVINLLPADETSHGFDNITVGDLSPTLLERYLSAARKISRTAVGTPLRAPGGETVNLPPDLTQENHFDGLPLGTRGGKVLRYTFPVDAEYDLVIRLARDRNEHVEGIAGTHQVDLLIDGKPVDRFTVKPPANGADHSQIDAHLNKRIRLTSGPHTISATFPRLTGNLLETERQPYQAHFNMDRHPRPQPAVYSITVNGPYGVQSPGDSPSRQRIFVCTSSAPPSSPEAAACAKRIFGALARRAFRRPLAEGDLEAPMRFFHQGASFEDGVELGLRAILVSPEFLFRVEADPAGAPSGTVYALAPAELASRLSYFLWSSLPDEDLSSAAGRGDLRNPAALAAQVKRMLADPRSSVLVTNFGGQWLYLRNLESITPDMRLFAGFDDNLRQAFRRETELLLDSVIREDRSILDLLRADYTFVNGRLAKHYGIPNVYGSRFQRVALGPDRVRGGILRHGSMLMVTSYATRTSPVIRGKWVLENLLGVPPPPPPASVPALPEKSASNTPMSMRERLSAHRDNPACRGCHQLMDPIGFALENFDAVGRHRALDNGRAVDSAGGLPDGSRFDGVAGLEQALLRRPEVIATTFAEKLMTYALGRGVTPADGPAIRRIVKEAEARDYRFSAFVEALVRSDPFQKRRTP